MLLSVLYVWPSYSVLASFYELVAVSCKPANDAERQPPQMQVHVLRDATRQPPMGYRDHQITSFKASDGYGTVVGTLMVAHDYLACSVHKSAHDKQRLIILLG